MGGASKLPILLSTPSRLLYPRPSLVHLSAPSQVPLPSLFTAVASARHRALSFSQPRHGFLLRAAAEQVHAQTGSREGRGESFGSALVQGVSSHRWPEWVKMVEHVTAGGYVDRRVSSAREEDDDTFTVLEGLPEEFTRAAGACLLFARERPDLLRLLPKRDIEVVVENGSPFLFKNALKSVERMKSFISSDGANVLGSGQAYTVDVMRYLLSYVCNSLIKGGGDDTNCRELVEASVRSLLCELIKADGAVREPHAAYSATQHSSFTYEQSQKPLGQKIVMKRGDWICPKCSFMNFAKNMECLECKEVRPRRQLTGQEWECPQCDFFNHGKNMACLRCDCKRLEEISPLEGRLGSVQYRRSLGNGNLVEANDSMGGKETDKMTESAISQSLDRILGRASATSETRETSNRSVSGEAGVRTGRRFTSPERRDPGYVPFVPLPADMFRKNTTTEQQPSAKEDSTPVKADEQTDAVLQGPGSGKSDEPYSEDFDTMTANKGLSDPSDRWSRNPAQHPDDNNVTSSTSDDDFPEIMPMRKGENRFVISKKKDRSLTSPQYKRRMAMEQANNSNFVPFVPFPPDYFAKKEKQPGDGSSTDESASETFAPAGAGNGQGMPQKAEENKIGETIWGDAGNNEQSESPKTLGNMGAPTLAQHTSNWQNNNSGTFSSRSPQGGAAGASRLNQKVENPQNKTDNGSRVFSGKSLEGSAVTEPDPLDMSEEAKAQRWFRRVAQINDISALSKIPDEDFPEIMPMRKGVNRFVVSKRKTPLERRLTSPQYRRNLPIVSSEPDKDSS